MSDDFEAFEKEANTPAAPDETPTPEPTPEPATEATTEAEAETEAETGADTPPEAIEVPDGEEDQDEDGKRRRSKPARQRIAEERWRRGEAERQLEQALTRIASLEGKVSPEPLANAPEKPDPGDFEFGDSDPAYQNAIVDWKLEVRDAERNKTQAEQREKEVRIEQLNAGVGRAEAAANAKYPDFEKRISEAIAERGGVPLPPIITVGIGVSPVGGEILYRLATDPDASERMERLAKGPPNALALALGELEGEYIDAHDDSDLDLSDQLDMARMLGRMRARLKPPAAASPEIAVTKAPTPPAQRARGGAGTFEARSDTTDFEAFERMANAANKR